MAGRRKKHSLNNSLEIQREQYKNLSDSIDTLRELKHNFKYDLLYIAEKIHDNESYSNFGEIMDVEIVDRQSVISLY